MAEGQEPGASSRAPGAPDSRAGPEPARAFADTARGVDAEVGGLFSSGMEGGKRSDLPSLRIRVLAQVFRHRSARIPSRVAQRGSAQTRAPLK